MSRNQEIAKDLRDWKQDLADSQQDSNDRLRRATELSKRYGRYANDPQSNPFDAVIKQETQRGIELGKAIVFTDALIGMADQDRLVDPNA
jgi:hypothetical protein